MIMKLQVVLFLTVCSGLNFVIGEVELVCPKPLDPSSTVTTYTELTPGPRTIVFRETRAISGAPYRLSIYRNNVESCVLLDHIPSQRDSDMYYITVNIPKIACNGVNDNCRMVLWQIDTSAGGYCNLANCPSYNSSAAVSIRRDGGAVGCPSRRANYNLYNWPFDPVTRYRSTITSQQSTARATGSFHLLGHTILYNVNVTVPFSNLQPQSVQFVYYPEGSTDPMVINTINIPSGRTGVMGSWTDVSDFTAYLLRNVSLYVQVVASGNSDTDAGLIIGGIVGIGNLVDDFYGLEYGMYSDGWLAGEMFVGAGANATLFTQPHGPCTLNVTRNFGCMLSSSRRGGGTVALSLTGNRLWFSMDMFNLSSPIRSVSLGGSSIDDLDLTPFWSNGNRLSGLTDVSDDIRSFLISGLISVSVSTTDNSRELSCRTEEGIIAFLDSFYEVPAVVVPTNGSGTAFMYFSVDGSVNFQITLNSLTSSLVAAHVHGPANQGLPTSNIPLVLDDYITGDMVGGWNLQGTWMNLTASELRYFVENLYYLNMHTTQNPAGELRGQVSVLGDWICPSTGALVNQCYWPRLGLVSSATVNSDRTPSAVAGVVIDRYQRLQYSLAFWYIPMGEVLTVQLQSPEGTLQVLVVDSGDSSDVRNNVWEAYSMYPAGYNQEIPALELQRIENGEVWFNVTSTSYPSGFLSTHVPPLTRNRCTGRMAYNVSVGGADGWVPTGSEYPDMRILQGDTLKFTFSSPDSLYEMENANRLAGCVFTTSTATLLADAETNNPNTYYYDIVSTDPKSHFFSSKESCQNQQMRLTTYTIATVPQSDRLDSSTCTRSLYSYSEEQRSSSSSGTAGAVVAAVLGVVFGIVIVAIAIAIGVFVMMKGRVSGDSGNLQKKA